MMNVHVMGPTEERLVDFVKPLNSVISDDLGTYIGPRFALDKLVRLLDSVCDMQYVIDPLKFWIVYFDSPREYLRSDSHQWVLIIGELVVPYVIVEMGRKEGIALERTGDAVSLSEMGTQPWAGVSERTKPPIRKRQRSGQQCWE
jgi:hypothetical protein